MVENTKKEDAQIVERLDNTISEEKLNKELDIFSQAAIEMLKDAKEENIKKVITNPSAIALSTTRHTAGDNINQVKKTVKQLFVLYLTNQFINRAVNVRSDTLISKGYKIIGEDETGVKLCKELIERSGGINLFWQLSTNTDIAGDGFLEKTYNKNMSKILKLKHVHPLTLEFDKDVYGRIKVDSNKEPIGYVQYYLDSTGVENTKPVSKDIIEHLRYNTLGDEFTGISIIQSGYDTVVRLMNMEYAAAEAAVKIANPIIVGKCNTKSPAQIAMWGTILGRINGRDQVFIPQDMELDTLSPGQQNFSEYADYFLNAVVAATGVPKGVLLGDSGGGGNRAEGLVLTRHFYSLISSNQKYQQDFFQRIFDEYGKIANFKPPILIFPDIAEDADLNAKSAIELFNAGLIDRNEAREMIGLKPSSDNTFKVTQSIQSQIDKSNMETWYPQSQGKSAGSQSGVKNKQKISKFSEVKSNTE